MEAGTLAGLTLLGGDDNAVVREGLAVVLRREGGTGILAGGGQEALACLRSKPPPDLVLLDMMMPGVDGWAALAETKRDPALAGMPVLIVTGLGVANAAGAGSLGA